MNAIGKGVARASGSGIWAVVESGQEVAGFDHGAFPNIADGSKVYFIDLHLDSFCDNVQSQFDVDDCVRRATPDNGFAAGAELRLRNYIMEALQVAVMAGKPQAYVDALKQKMQEVHDSAMELPSKKVTVALLKRLGISG
ncbi:hypothetical protein [Lysobacter enzymogenes]|uniref:hypothetical protein n=1 Tax=Lysobacter enzymogenes TaxID=69 RepID=UPI001A964C58|nr:hypothetical protein [Lysobacter enzymogenes]QQP98150.1 hypothetical protein JHW38_09215 [Lysobacter enzymogenes]